MIPPNAPKAKKAGHSQRARHHEYASNRVHKTHIVKPVRTEDARHEIQRVATYTTCEDCTFPLRKNAVLKAQGHDGNNNKFYDLEGLCGIACQERRPSRGDKCAEMLEPHPSLRRMLSLKHIPNSTDHSFSKCTQERYGYRNAAQGGATQGPRGVCAQTVAPMTFVIRSLLEQLRLPQLRFKMASSGA